MKKIFLLLLLTTQAHAVGLDFLLNNQTRPVRVDTVTPGNSVPYPFAYYNALGVRTDLATDAGLTALSAKFGTLGQKTMAGSAPVVIASDQSSLPVTISGTTPISGTVSISQVTPGTTNGVVVNSSALPTGAATEATLSTLNGKFGTIGQKTAAGSAPVVLASDQTLPLPTGAATEATLSALNAKVANNYGVATGAVRSAAQIGNATGVADFGAGNTSAQTVRVVAAADQPAIAVKGPFNPQASTTTNTTVSTSPQTISVPANATGFKIYALDTNTSNLRISLGGAVTTTTGVQLQAGRSEDFPLAVSISICSETGSGQGVVVVWYLSQ